MTEERLSKLIEQEGLELYSTELVTENKQQIYRVYITKKGGVNLDDCQKISQIISPLLDLEEPANGKYFLEVSSPGIERKLVKPRHFQASLNELVKVKKDKEVFTGTLISADETSFCIQSEDEKLCFLYQDIKTCKTFIQW